MEGYDFAEDPQQAEDPGQNQHDTPLPPVRRNRGIRHTDHGGACPSQGDDPKRDHRPQRDVEVESHGSRLTLERPGRMHQVFKAGENPGRFVHEATSQAWIEFVRSEDGTVTAMRTSFGGRVELDPRHVPQEGLPSVDDVIASVKRAHRIDRLSEIGVVRLSGTLEIEARQIEASLTTLFDVTRVRTEIRFGAVEQLVVINDGRVWTYATPTGAEGSACRRVLHALTGEGPGV